ncbi:centrosomal protein centrin 3 [Cryptosporidium ubiquitum]|uniref:Centrosomal protein centrin 3 n=1 Tax=Cryptosporidium ubiquitum TaxID=857276 RepID=A0A1J4MEY7_9CRYT|nr:centrosomal protein centrin 3 [Cryptosporidium ubiquitum]OII72769.1 centrosomal protein centrin 3 [Cryptosporidium ubiquitum]
MNSGELNKEQIEDARSVFEVFDTDRNGLVDRRELKAALRALGFDVGKKDIELVFTGCFGSSYLGMSSLSNKALGNSMGSSHMNEYSSSIGKDLEGERGVNFEEFCQILGYLMTSQNQFGVGAFYGTSDPSQEVSIEYVKRVFSLFDIGNNGKVGIRSLKTLVSQISRESLSLSIRNPSESGDTLFSDDDLNQMIKHIDRDGDGFLDFEDFYRVFQYCHSSTNNEINF